MRVGFDNHYPPLLLGRASCCRRVRLVSTNVRYCRKGKGKEIRRVQADESGYLRMKPPNAKSRNVSGCDLVSTRFEKKVLLLRGFSFVCCVSFALVAALRRCAPCLRPPRTHCAHSQLAKRRFGFLELCASCYQRCSYGLSDRTPAHNWFSQMMFHTRDK